MIILRILFCFFCFHAFTETNAQKVAFSEEVPLNTKKITTKKYRYYSKEKSNALETIEIIEYDDKKRVVGKSEINYSPSDIDMVYNISSSNGTKKTFDYQYETMGEGLNTAFVKKELNKNEEKLWVEIKKDTVFGDQTFEYTETSFNHSQSMHSSSKSSTVVSRENKIYYSASNEAYRATTGSTGRYDRSNFMETNYEYDDSMQLMVKQAINIIDSYEVSDSITHYNFYEYQPDGKPSKEFVFEVTYRLEKGKSKNMELKKIDSSFIEYVNLPKGYIKQYKYLDNGTLFKIEHFDEKNNKFKAEAFDQELNKMLITEEYFYNSTNKCIEERSYYEGEIDVIYYNTYNAQGFLTSVTFKVPETGKIVPVKEIIYE